MWLMDMVGQPSEVPFLMFCTQQQKKLGPISISYPGVI